MSPEFCASTSRCRRRHSHRRTSATSAPDQYPDAGDHAPGETRPRRRTSRYRQLHAGRGGIRCEVAEAAAHAPDDVTPRARTWRVGERRRPFGRRAEGTAGPSSRQSVHRMWPPCGRPSSRYSFAKGDSMNATSSLAGTSALTAGNNPLSDATDHAHQVVDKAAEKAVPRSSVRRRQRTAPSTRSPTRRRPSPSGLPKTAARWSTGRPNWPTPGVTTCVNVHWLRLPARWPSDICSDA